MTVSQARVPDPKVTVNPSATGGGGRSQREKVVEPAALQEQGGFKGACFI
jgi:hypothetical protein